MSPAVLWSLVAAGPAVLAEYLYRTLPGPWLSYVWVWIPIQLTIGYAICQLVRSPGLSLMDSFVYWAFATLAMRVFVTLVLLRDPVSKGTWAALALVVLARIVQSIYGGR